MGGRRYFYFSNPKKTEEESGREELKGESKKRTILQRRTPPYSAPPLYFLFLASSNFISISLPFPSFYCFAIYIFILPCFMSFPRFLFIYLLCLYIRTLCIRTHF